MRANMPVRHGYTPLWMWCAASAVVIVAVIYLLYTL
jgi:hypothetical protein